MRRRSRKPINPSNPSAAATLEGSGMRSNFAVGQVAAGAEEAAADAASGIEADLAELAGVDAGARDGAEVKMV